MPQPRAVHKDVLSKGVKKTGCGYRNTAAVPGQGHLPAWPLCPILAATCSAAKEHPGHSRDQNPGDVQLWADGLTALCLSFLFCKMETFQMVPVKTQWAHTCEMTGLWPVHSCSARVRSRGGGAVGVRLVCTLCRPGLTGLHEASKSQSSKSRKTHKSIFCAECCCPESQHVSLTLLYIYMRHYLQIKKLLIKHLNFHLLKHLSYCVILESSESAAAGLWLPLDQTDSSVSLPPCPSLALWR